MADRNFNEESRWRNTGTRIERDEEQDRSGNRGRRRPNEPAQRPNEPGPRPEDRGRVRNYDREDMRSYARRSVNQGDRLRGMRGGHGDYGNEMGRTSNRGYGHSHDAGRNFQREEGRRSSRGDFDRNIDERGFERGYGYDRNRSTGADFVDNYWGEREQGGRAFRQRDDRDWDRVYRRDPREDDWWNTTGGRPDFTSARSYDYGRSTEFDRDQDSFDSREYDMDPGFAYEFGTDYDFMRDTTQRDFGRRGGRDREEWDRQRSSQGGQGQNPRMRQGRETGQNQGMSYRESRRQPRPGQERGGMDRNRDARSQESGYGEFWNVPGPYRGVGPSSYQRSDERIKDEICQIFTEHGQIDSSGIDIEVQNGEVTLSGDVDRRREKYLAEDVASSVMGVHDVNNQIRVMPGDGARVRGMGREDVVMPGRIQPGMRVAGVDGKHIGQVRDVRVDGFILSRGEGRDAFIPFRAVKRTNGQIILHVHNNEIDQQNWRENR